MTFDSSFSHAVEGSDQRVYQHAVKHAKEATVVVVVLRVEEADAVE